MTIISNIFGDLMSTSRNYQLPEHTRQRLFDLIPTLSFCFIFMVIVFSPEGGTTYNRIREFDGLIASAFAILAAFITVRQMKKSDDKQEERHSQLMELQLLPLKAKSIKLCKLSIPKVQACIKAISAFEGSLSDPHNGNQCRNFLIALLTIKSCSEIFIDPLFSEQRDILPIDVEFAFRDARLWIDCILSSIPDGEFTNFHKYMRSEKFPDWYGDYHYPLLSDLRDFLVDLENKLRDWIRITILDYQDR